MNTHALRIPIGDVKVPSTMIDMLSGRSNLAVYNQYFNLPCEYHDSLIEKDVIQGSKVNFTMSPPVLLYKGYDEKYTSNYTFLLQTSKESVDFKFISPYSEVKSTKRYLECSTNPTVIETLCRLENLFTYCSEYLILAKFSNIPKEVVAACKTDKDLVNALFGHIFDGDLSKPMKYLSDRYYECIANPPVWTKEDKKWVIRATDDECEGLSRYKVNTLSEVLYKTMTPSISTKFKNSARFFKFWIGQRQILIPSTKRICYEKKVKGTNDITMVETYNNAVKINIYFENTEDNVRKNLYKPKMPISTFTQTLSPETRQVSPVTFAKYVNLYGGSEEFTEGEHIEFSMKTWKGKLVFKIIPNTTLFGMGYPRIDNVVKCVVGIEVPNKSSDDYLDLIDNIDAGEADPEDL